MPFSKRQSLLNFVLNEDKLHFVPLAAGMALIALLVVVLFCAAFYGKRLLMASMCTTISVSLDSMLVEDLTSIAEPGVEAIYLHHVNC